MKGKGKAPSQDTTPRGTPITAPKGKGKQGKGEEADLYGKGVEDYGERADWNKDDVSIPDADEDAPAKSKYAMGDVDDLDDDMYDDTGADANGRPSNGTNEWQQQQQGWGYGYGGYQQVQQVHSNWQQLTGPPKQNGDDTGI